VGVEPTRGDAARNILDSRDLTEQRKEVRDVHHLSHRARRRLHERSGDDERDPDPRLIGAALIDGKADA
jgi:hypothetical protein